MERAQQQVPTPALDHAVARDRAMQFLVTIKFADSVVGVHIGGEVLELLAIMFQSAFSEGVIAGFDQARAVMRVSSDEFERRQRERFETALAEREQLCGRRTGLLASPDPGK